MRNGRCAATVDRHRRDRPQRPTPHMLGDRSARTSRWPTRLSKLEIVGPVARPCSCARMQEAGVLPRAVVVDLAAACSPCARDLRCSTRLVERCVRPAAAAASLHSARPSCSNRATTRRVIGCAVVTRAHDGELLVRRARSRSAMPTLDQSGWPGTASSSRTRPERLVDRSGSTETPQVRQPRTTTAEPNVTSTRRAHRGSLHVRGTSF